MILGLCDDWEQKSPSILLKEIDSAHRRIRDFGARAEKAEAEVKRLKAE